jgi:hypothetical protein
MNRAFARLCDPLSFLGDRAPRPDRRRSRHGGGPIVVETVGQVVSDTLAPWTTRWPSASGSRTASTSSSGLPDGKQPEASDYWDGNWVYAIVKIAARAFRGEFEAQLRAEEFVSFRDQLRPLPESLKGHAEFETTEGWLIIDMATARDGAPPNTSAKAPGDSATSSKVARASRRKRRGVRGSTACSPRRTSLLLRRGRAPRQRESCSSRRLAPRAVLREEASHHDVAVLLRTRVLTIATVELLGHPLRERALVRLNGCKLVGMLGHLAL